MIFLILLLILQKSANNATGSSRSLQFPIVKNTEKNEKKKLTISLSMMISYYLLSLTLCVCKEEF